MDGYSNGFRTLERAFSILLSFDWNTQKLSLTDISKRISLPKSTTFRFLSTLEKDGFLIKNEDNTYTLGHTLYYLGTLAKESFGLRKAAYPVMQRLQEKYNETVSLYIMEDLQRVCYERIESTHRLRGIPQLGGKSPLWSGACGKAILAFVDEDHFLKVAGGIERLTDKTIVAIDELKKQLEEIRKSKISFSFDETEMGISAVASPVFDASNNIIGSISMAGPSVRFTRDFVYSVQNCVFETAKEVSFNSGCRNY
ncbi:MAG: IclR family transcriptional regulator [Dethiobacter sp.]|jgi:DNA-binding IclR family transcriptional regulator|nr:IclR family transcriptional regulator [Dethiobacter sp.]